MGCDDGGCPLVRAKQREEREIADLTAPPPPGRCGQPAARRRAPARRLVATARGRIVSLGEGPALRLRHSEGPTASSSVPPEGDSHECCQKAGGVGPCHRQYPGAFFAGR